MKIISYSDLHLEFGTDFKPPTDSDADVFSPSSCEAETGFHQAIERCVVGDAGYDYIATPISISANISFGIEIERDSCSSR